MIYANYREWPYKNVPKRIIAEKYMPSDKGLIDYKVHNFNGIPKFILVCRDRYGTTPMAETFFSDKWEKLDLKRPGHPNPSMEKPKSLQEILKLAALLSKDLPFARTDFYIIDDKVYFGEITFYPASGLSPFNPEIYDRIFGDLLHLVN